MTWRLSLIAALALTGTWTQAASPPPPAELEKLLDNEPINEANWSKWSPRLREWSGEQFEAASPAFLKAFDYFRSLPKAATGKSLPKPMEKDAVAWMVLAGALQHDPTPGQGPVLQAQASAAAARQSIRLDKGLARAHFYLFQAIRQEQYTPAEQGGPARPDRNRLRGALDELKRARELAPAVVWLANPDAARLAIEAQKWDDAELYLRLALKEQPTNVDFAHLLARSINEYRHQQPYAVVMKPLIEQFPDDGILASHYARALVQDKRRDEAASQLVRARKLGTDPAAVIDPKMVSDVEQESARKAADLARRQKEQAETERRKQQQADQEQARKAADLARQQKEQAEAERRRQEQQAEAARRKAEEDAQRETVAAVGSFFRTAAWWCLGLVLFYACLMGTMSLTGWLLARRTRGLRAAEMLGDFEGTEDRSQRGKVFRTKHESKLTRFYGLALLVGLLFFYAALPVVFLGLLVVMLLLVVFTLLTSRGQGSDDVHGTLLHATGGSMEAVFKALFARASIEGFGVLKGRDDCPTLFGAIDEVAGRVETEPPDEVWIAPGAEFSVYQKGRGPFGVFGGRKRVLTVGLCVLHYLSIGEFKSILAHEFAHFSHDDTFWNRFLFQVSLSLRTACREMARTGGWVTWCNPFYWFFWLYSKSYNLLSAGFSRSREFLADRMACVFYGSDVFASGLRKVCTDGVHFETVIYKNILRLLRQNQAFINMYLAFRKLRDEGMTDEERKRLHRKFLDGAPSLFASHPTFRERLEAAGHLPRSRRKEDIRALGLFEQPEVVERELTDYFTARVAEAYHF